MTKIIIEQDTVDFYVREAQDFFTKILDTNYDEVLITDLSCLSDFNGRGFGEDSAEKDEFYKLINSEESSSYSDILDFWDNFIINKIKNTYGVEISSTNIKLIDIFSQLSDLKKVVYKH